MTTPLDNLNDALHELIQTVRMLEANDDSLEQAGATLRALNSSLSEQCFDGMTCALGLDIGDVDFNLDTQDLVKLSPYSPITGRLNPISPRVKLQVNDDGSVTGTATFPPAFCGPPDSVHGGMVAAIFDELLSMANIANYGLGGMTANLAIRYRKPTPLNDDIELFAEVRGTDGRKATVYGELRHQGEVTASAEALFVIPAGFEKTDR